MALYIVRNRYRTVLWTSEFGKVDPKQPQAIIMDIPTNRYQRERLVAFFVSEITVVEVLRRVHNKNVFNRSHKILTIQ